MPRHSNVALFIPHAGCPHHCSFCNQRAIAGGGALPGAAEVVAACERAAATMRTPAAEAEIAFFGGSFTALERGYMESLLAAAYPYIERGWFRGIRVSTRPDAIDGTVLALLRRYGVTAIELGAQSMDDAVLAANGRGHTARQVTEASRQIREAGFALGLQMMTGLPGDSCAGAWETARRLADLGPATMRLYPTIVMAGTALAAQYRAGTYVPPTLDEAVTLCAGLLRYVEDERGIPVIRLGLHASVGLATDMIAGPWHPAFRELCEAVLYREAALAALREQLPSGGVATLLVAPAAVSPMIGQRRANLAALRAAGYRVRVQADSSVPRRRVAVVPEMP